jgi:hypothetical protein
MLRGVLANWDAAGGLTATPLPPNGRVWDGGGEYILKRGGERQLRRSIAVANALEAQGFAVAEPVATRSGGYIAAGERASCRAKSYTATRTPATSSERAAKSPGSSISTLPR